MKKRNITIHDIARELNITASTVSRALNNHPRISKSTKKAVLEVAARLHYQPNNLASNLRTGKGKTIGVIVPRVNRHFFANVIGGIEEIANEEGFRVIICQSHEKYDKEVENVKALLNARVDCIMISLSSETRDIAHLKLVKERGTPLLFFDRASSQLETSKVIVDNYNGAYKIVQNMILGGCTKIVHLAGPLHLDIYNDRNEGYRQALKDAQIDFSLSFEQILTKEQGTEVIKALIEKGEKPDGIFASSDFSALGAYLYLKQNGFNIPDDVSVAGFANEPFTELLNPPLSTVDQHSQKIGREVALLFLKQYYSDEKPMPETIVINPEVYIRESIKQ